MVSRVKTKIKKIPKKIRKTSMYEYSVVRLGSSPTKNQDMLNKKSAQGWELVTAATVSKQSNATGAYVNEIQAILRKEIIVSDEKKDQLITG